MQGYLLLLAVVLLKVPLGVDAKRCLGLRRVGETTRGGCQTPE